MSFLPVVEYLAGIVVFGFLYWILNGILDIFKASGIAITGDVYDLVFFFWAGIIIVYLVFGGWWLIRKYDEMNYQEGFR